MSQTCPKCNRLSENGQYCKKDAIPFGAKGIIVSAYYEEGPVKEIIHNFKYNHILELKEVSSDLMVEALKNNLPDKKNIVITAVPMHFLKKAQRGYNQSEILAEEVGFRLGGAFKVPASISPARKSGLSARLARSLRSHLPARLRDLLWKTPAPPFLEEKQSCPKTKNIEINFNILQKFRKTKSQVKFSGKKRRENLKNCFKISPKNNIDLVGRIIILVDDVTTTGTTINECAKVLREAGAKRVWGLVVARG